MKDAIGFQSYEKAIDEANKKGKVYFGMIMGSYASIDRPVLHLNLHARYFDKIESGEKPEEYRKTSAYWGRIFHGGSIKIKGKYYHASEVIICFSNGYSKNRRQMMVECKGFSIGEGREEWGAIKGEEYYILSLGRKIELKNQLSLF